MMHRVAAKPLVVGEFPLEGLESIPGVPESALSLADAYDQLWEQEPHTH